jgi:hypothetical protein
VPPAASAKLTVFAAATVVSAEGGLLAIMRILASKAKANTGHGLPARCGNAGATFGAMAQGRTLRQTALRAADPILHRRVDLILYRTVAGPTRRHSSLHKSPNDAIATLASAFFLWSLGLPIASCVFSMGYCEQYPGDTAQ